jgi:hypothetical protein
MPEGMLHSFYLFFVVIVVGFIKNVAEQFPIFHLQSKGFILLKPHWALSKARQRLIKFQYSPVWCYKTPHPAIPHYQIIDESMTCYMSSRNLRILLSQSSRQALIVPQNICGMKPTCHLAQDLRV